MVCNYLARFGDYRHCSNGYIYNGFSSTLIKGGNWWKPKGGNQLR